MNNIRKIGPYFEQYRNGFCDVLKTIDYRSLEVVVSALLEARMTGKNIFIMGNGGSAAASAHFAIDFLTNSFRIFDLTSNPSILTAIGNDHGYDQIFVKQLERYLCSGDIVMVLSASGNSPNVVKAVEYANKNNAVTIGFVGFDGGKLVKLCKYFIHIETQKGEYGLVEDVFMFLDHLITSYLAKLE